MRDRGIVMACAALVLAAGAREAASEPQAADATPAPQTATAPPAPMVVTRALMRQVASSKAKLDAVVDRDAGVVFIDHFAGPADEPAPAVEKLLCGRALDRQLKIVRGWMYAATTGDGVDGSPTCRNRPGPPTCTFGRSMEWDPAVHLVFRVDAARGVVLQAITIDDEVLVDGKVVGEEHRAQARLIAKLGARRCPAT